MLSRTMLDMVVTFLLWAWEPFHWYIQVQRSVMKGIFVMHTNNIVLAITTMFLRQQLALSNSELTLHHIWGFDNNFLISFPILYNGHCDYFPECRYIRVFHSLVKQLPRRQRWPFLLFISCVQAFIPGADKSCQSMCSKTEHSKIAHVIHHDFNVRKNTQLFMNCQVKVFSIVSLLNVNQAIEASSKQMGCLAYLCCIVRLDAVVECQFV